MIPNTTSTQNKVESKSSSIPSQRGKDTSIQDEVGPIGNQIQLPKGLLQEAKTRSFRIFSIFWSNSG